MKIIPTIQIKTKIFEFFKYNITQTTRILSNTYTLDKYILYIIKNH